MRSKDAPKESRHRLSNGAAFLFVQTKPSNIECAKLKWIGDDHGVL